MTLFSDDDFVLSNLNSQIPQKEKKRVRVLQEARILKKDHAIDFDIYTDLLSRILKLPISFITIVDYDRVHIRSKLCAVEKISKNKSISSFVISDEAPLLVLVPDASQDPRFMNVPHVKGEIKIKFFASTPLICNGCKLGILLVADIVPRYDITEEQMKPLLECGAMISELFQEQYKRNVQLQKEQIQYLVGITNNLQLPTERIQFTYVEILRLFEKLKHCIKQRNIENIDSKQLNQFTCQIQRYLNLFIEKINLFSNQLKSLSHHLNLSLQLAYITSETKRFTHGNSFKTSSEQFILNKYLHPDITANESVPFIPLNHILTSIQSFLYPDHLVDMNINPIQWNLSSFHEQPPSISVDQDLLSLVLHSLLAPSYHAMNDHLNCEYFSPSFRSFSNLHDLYKTQFHNYSSVRIEVELKDPQLLQQSHYINENNLDNLDLSENSDSLNRPVDLSSSFLPPSDIFEKTSNLKYLVLTILPKSYCDSESQNSSLKKPKLTRKQTIRSLNIHNYIEYSEQSLLRDILQSSYGGFEVFIPSDMADSQLSYQDMKEHAVYRIWTLCLVNDSYVASSSDTTEGDIGMILSDELDQPIDSKRNFFPNSFFYKSTERDSDCTTSEDPLDETINYSYKLKRSNTDEDQPHKGGTLLSSSSSLVSKLLSLTNSTSTRMTLPSLTSITASLPHLSSPRVVPST